MTITLTKAEALRIQATQLDHYADMYGEWIRAAVAARTNADVLPDDVAISVIEVNRCIPRGGAIEGIVCERRGHDFTLPPTARCRRCNARWP